MKPWRFIGTTTVLLLLTAGCGGGPDTAPSPTQPESPGPTATTAGSTAVAAPTTGAATSGQAPEKTWSTGPLVRDPDIGVPPVPLLVGIRAAAHPGFDRIVFDFKGPLPGYDIRYVSRVIKDPSGEPATVSGRRFLLIRFQPTNAHDEAGRPTVPRGAAVNLPMMRAYQVVGDFEAVVSVAVGLDDTVGLRVGELPNRLYLDVAA